jgi:general secretion pathway protein D
MKSAALKSTVLGLAGLCLLAIIFRGTVISQSEPVPPDANEPAQPVAAETQPRPLEAQQLPDAPAQPEDAPAQPEDASDQPEGQVPDESMRFRRGTGTRPDSGDRTFGPRFDGGQRGFGTRGFGGDRFLRPEPVTALGAGDPNTPMEAINLNNVEMRQIIQKIAEWTGKPVIPVNDEIMQTRVTIYSPTTVARQEALRLLIMALQARGVVVEQLDNRVMLRPLATIRLGSVPTLGPDEPLARIEDQATIVEKWFKLDNYSPTRLIQIITPLVADYGYAVADEETSRVAVIDTVENLMRIERLIRQLDLPEINQQVEKVFELRYADPSEVVQVLQMILADTQAAAGRDVRTRRSSSTQQSAAPPAPSASSGGRSGGGVTSVVLTSEGQTPIQLFPLPKQRWILVRGSQEDIQRIEEWIKRLDMEDEEEMRQSVVQVRYADVREVVRMVQNTLQQMPGTDLKANIVVEALTQTSQIVIYGSDSNRFMVERLIAQIDLPKEDFFVERTFNLKHADPDQIKTNIEKLYSETTSTQPQFGRFQTVTTRRPEDIVRVISYPLRKQVTVIASPQNMERIARQIEEEWDKPLDIEQDQYRVISLNNSDPVKMADLLKRLFSEESTSAAGSQNLMRMIFGGTTEDSRQKIVGSLYGMLTFEAVPDTKKLIVISQVPEAYDVVERLIQKLDARDEADVPRVITLKYADPEALCDQLNAILNEPGTPATIQRSARGLSAYDTTRSQAVTTSEESGSVITPWWTRQRVDTTEMPTSNLIGRVRFVPVHRSKAILVLSPPQHLEDITAMIHELDRPAMQVMIKAVILEINLSDTTSLGIQLASNEQAFGSTLGPNALTALNTLLYRGPERGSTLGDNSSTHFSTVTDADIAVLVDMLVKHANGQVLNQPTLWTKDNEEAVFVKGQKVAFITGEQTANTGSTQRAFEFEDVGVTLRIRPRITPEKAVDLTINLNISQISAEELNQQPVRSNLDSTTHMIINDGQSVMMGGMLYQDENFIEHKIPLLGDLPLLGELFKHEYKGKANNEILVFVTPHVIDDAILSGFPIQEGTQEFHEKSLRRFDQAVESLSQNFMKNTSFELIQEDDVSVEN